MSYATVDGDDGLFAGCCPIPKPRRGPPHVAHWLGDVTSGHFGVARLDPEAAIRLGTALLAAGKEVTPKKEHYLIGELELRDREEAEDE